MRPQRHPGTSGMGRWLQLQSLNAGRHHDTLDQGNTAPVIPRFACDGFIFCPHHNQVQAELESISAFPAIIPEGL